MSEGVRHKPVAPFHAMAYQGRTMYVATHLNVTTKVASGVSMTTVMFLEEKGTWRKMLMLQFLSADKVAPSDAEILKRFDELKFQPALAK